MARGGKNEVAVGGLVLFALVLLGYMALKVGALREMGVRAEVSAVFEDVAGLTKGAAVQVAGVNVGLVTALSVEGSHARVAMAIDESAGLRKDALVRIRARSLLGEKYVEAIPVSQTAPLLEDGDEMAVGVEQVEIDELVSRMGPVVSAVDPEVLSELMRSLNKAFKDDPEQASRMLHDLETVLHNAALASEEAPALVAEARATLTSVRRAADDARPVLAHADSVVTRLDAATLDLPTTVDNLDGLIGETRAAVADGQAMLTRVDGSMSKVDVVLDNLSEIDKWELRRLLREEGIVVRLKEHTVVPTD